MKNSRILLTRASHQQSGMAEALRERGAIVYGFPVIGVRPPESLKEIDQAIDRLEGYDWLIFTSVNAVLFLNRIKERGCDCKPKIAAIGPSTARAIKNLGFEVDCIPNVQDEGGLAEGLSGARGRVLIPRASDAKQGLVIRLKQGGMQVDTVCAYEKFLPSYSVEEIQGVKSFKPEWVLFTSSSTVTNTVKLLGKEFVFGLRIACLGPVTRATLRDIGLKVDVMAPTPTVESLITAWTPVLDRDGLE